MKIFFFSNIFSGSIFPILKLRLWEGLSWLKLSRLTSLVSERPATREYLYNIISPKIFHEMSKYFANMKMAYLIDTVLLNDTQTFIYLFISCLREWLSHRVIPGGMANGKVSLLLPRINHEFPGFTRSLQWLNVVHLASTLLDLTFHIWYSFSSLLLFQDDTLKRGIQRADLYAPGNLSHSPRLGFVSVTTRDHQELSFIDRITVGYEVIPTLMNMYWTLALKNLYTTSGLIKENWSTVFKRST
jgi:hypothetical protein